MCGQALATLSGLSSLVRRLLGPPVIDGEKCYDSGAKNTSLQDGIWATNLFVGRG